MKKNPRKHLKPRRRITRKGIALITVLSLLAITTLLIAAFFSLAKVELISSDTYAKGIRSRQLSETAVNIAMSQIKKATIPPAGTDTPYYAWASQPGAIRKYDLKGNFYEAYSFYSDNNMIVDSSEGERSLVEDSPPSDWKSQPERYVDLNAPVIRRGSDGDEIADEIFFPIIDPTARNEVPGVGTAQDPSTLAGIKGFDYSETYLDGTVDSNVIRQDGAISLGGTVTARLPMPVEWLYVLQDGTLGFLDEDNGDRFVGQGPNGAEVTASLDNPIVGRIAFWTDDETTKININTASEPTFWNVPWLFSDVDYLNATRQPGLREFQRYPGHPATTALSPVLFPDMYDDYSSTAPDKVFSSLKDRKEEIYRIIPRIGLGGSEGGTVEVNELTTTATSHQIKDVEIDDDRLYASLDELIFAPADPSGATTAVRKENNLLDSRSLQRAQAFLTANSRAPETNLFNMPRISIWPIHRRAVRPDTVDSSISLGSGYDERFGSGFDNLIAFCSTVSGIPYFFMRENADDPSHDMLKIRPNFDLFYSGQKGYLWNLADTPIPGYGHSFTDKYGINETNQILTEIFDYIRCTNLYDDLVAVEGGYEPVYNGVNPNNGLPRIDQPLRPDLGGDEIYTFTDPRDSRPVTRSGEEDEFYRIFPGHGQVTPIEIPSRGGGVTRGMGRFFTLSEVSLQFICNADGNQATRGHEGAIDYRNGKSIRADASPEGAIQSHLAGFAKQGEKANLIQVFGGAAAPSNTVPITDEAGNKGFPIAAPDQKFWYSGFPPLPPNLIPTGDKAEQPDKFPYYTTNPQFPGYDPRNWNYALGKVPDGKTAQEVRDKYLLKNDATTSERLVQMMIHFETFSPSLGWTAVAPEMHFVIKGLDQFTLEDQPLYTNLPMTNTMHASSAGSFLDGGQRGGPNGLRALVNGKYYPPRQRLDDDIGSPLDAIPADTNYVTIANRGQDWRLCPLVSNIVTVEAKKSQAYPTMDFKGGVITVELHLGRAPGAANDKLIQTFEMEVPDADFVQPQLVLYGTPQHANRNTGNIDSHDTAPPFWWSFNRDGGYGLEAGQGVRRTGEPYLAEKPTPYGSAKGGRAIGGWPGLFDPDSPFAVSVRDNPRQGNFMRREDTIQSIVPWHGDYRHVLAAKQIKDSDQLFLRHFNYGKSQNQGGQHAHNLYMAQNSNRVPDFKRSNLTMLSGVGLPGKPYPANRWPDWPESVDRNKAKGFFQLTQDFDNGMADAADGPYINKPDEGNTRIRTSTNSTSVPYLTNSFAQEAAGPSYFSPNRQLPSPVMFGSLPSGIKGSPNIASGRTWPWRTLLFRPPIAALRHPGERDYLPSGDGDVPDHVLLDFFWMPVVEPYAVSEPFSTAGKINLNYQILPFTNITRATGIYGLLRGEKVLCYPNGATTGGLRRPRSGPGNERLPNENSMVSSNIVNGRWWDNTKTRWWRDIDIAETLKQFDDLEDGKFSRGEIFRSGSEICEVNLVPTDANGKTAEDGGRVRIDYVTVKGKKIWRMTEGGSAEFYGNLYKPTGDNARERPYVNVYPRVTTKSNTFQVHYRVQTVQKSKFTDPGLVDLNRDAVTSEFRGSTIVERYIDPNDPAIPDYREFKSKNHPPLDKFYRYRIVSNKRFAP